MFLIRNIVLSIKYSDMSCLVVNQKVQKMNLKDIKNIYTLSNRQVQQFTTMSIIFRGSDIKFSNKKFSLSMPVSHNLVLFF